MVVVLLVTGASIPKRGSGVFVDEMTVPSGNVSVPLQLHSHCAVDKEGYSADDIRQADVLFRGEAWTMTKAEDPHSRDVLPEALPFEWLYIVVCSATRNRRFFSTFSS